MQTGSCAYENPAFVFDGELYLPKLSFMSLFNFHVASVSLQKSAIFFQFETSFLSNYVKVQLSDKRIHIGPAFNQVHLELLSEDLSVQDIASNYRGSWILTFSLLTCALFKLKEWILVLLTLLRSSEVWLDSLT
ncbi:hypothetical protein Ahy_A04g018135 isoform A [Arachis hypogaea]|uniref:Uncharacterized protein n=1 Tax=Arachis hypogaea TaxID=3818 RepID=A0A445DCZ9_ARAHY|nr:hypothetical protein Ahy_A04g018135 isoform A [Arachis hypogaea]